MKAESKYWRVDPEMRGGGSIFGGIEEKRFVTTWSL